MNVDFLERGCNETPGAFVWGPAAQPVRRQQSEEEQTSSGHWGRYCASSPLLPFNLSSHTCASSVTTSVTSEDPLVNQNVSGTAGRQLHGKDSNAGMWCSWTKILIVESYIFHIPYPTAGVESKWFRKLGCFTIPHHCCLNSSNGWHPFQSHFLETNQCTI